MSFFRLWGRKKAGGEADAAPPPAPSDEEEFSYSVRLVYVPPQGNARVWKTQTARASATQIWLLPPNTEWESSLPRDKPVSVVLVGAGEMAEFDSVLTPQRQGGELWLLASRPAVLEWKKADTGGNQHRKFLRVDVSLMAEVATLEPGAGGKLKASAPRNGRVTDLSIQGMSLRLDFDPGAGRLIEIRVLSHHFSLQAQARVIRARRVAESDVFPYEAAVSFENLSSVTRDMIGSFILSKQRAGS